ncbi:hypothetical protein [Phycicoccus sp.]|uniref:hypothetical protein n=1 Tax=Phycicoccus sp. TaxID=1902410 RepID=UPI002C662A8D|nr:hypothetical protein [Phycicoccus sp.]HMM95344.1 hypothetical protein [Phycicoccus sp.]
MSAEFERCEHGGTAAYCPDCIAESRAVHDTTMIDRPVIGATITAQYAGDCACCGFRYPEGTRIVYVDDGDMVLGWVGEKHLARQNATQSIYAAAS